MTPKQERPPQLFVERAAAGVPQPELELTDAERDALESRARQLRDEDERDRRSPPPELERALGAVQRAPDRRPYLAAAAALLALGGAALLALGAPSDHPGPDPSAPTYAPQIRAKGAEAPSLLAWRQRAGVTHPIGDGDPVRAGDVLQLAYRAQAPGFGAIASVDGAGHVTLHFPSAPGPAGPLSPGEPVRLKRAFRLDDAPQFERVVLLSSPETFDASALTDALAATPDADPALALGAPYASSIVTFPK